MMFPQLLKLFIVMEPTGRLFFFLISYVLPASALVLTKTQMQHDVMKVVKLNAVKIVRFLSGLLPDS